MQIYLKTLEIYAKVFKNVTNYANILESVRNLCKYIWKRHKLWKYIWKRQKFMQKYLKASEMYANIFQNVTYYANIWKRQKFMQIYLKTSDIYAYIFDNVDPITFKQEHSKSYFQSLSRFFKKFAFKTKTFESEFIFKCWCAVEMWHFVEKFAEYCAESFLIVGKIGLPTASNKQGSQEKSKVEKEQKSPKHFWKSNDLTEPWDVDLSPSFIISRSPSI